MCTTNQFAKCTLPLDFHPILCHTYSMTQTQYTRQQLIDALSTEYDTLCQEDYDPDVDMSSSQYVEYLSSLSIEQLIDETSCDDLDEYMSSYF